MTFECLRKVTLIRNANCQCHLGEWQIGLFEEALRALKATAHDILMGTFSGRLPKAACKVKGA